jgi:gliding motility-associated-like protein
VKISAVNIIFQARLLKFGFCSFLFFSLDTNAQCPVNIDFESGNFSGWQCYTGIASPRNISLSPSSPLPTRHVMYSAGNDNGVDYWGGFPKICPNGSNYSVRLGNDSTGRQAEAISYTFTVPPGQQIFTLVYNYAVVLQDPGHPPDQQPRLSIEVFNVTDNIINTCSSFDFVSNGGLPGFQDSPKSSNSPVKYNDWSACFVNLSGNAGKTFRISFTTTDCTEAAHFGYAYIDAYTLAGCNNAVPTSVFCRDDDFADLSGPPGFQSYKWFTTANTVLGTQQVLHLRPLPRAGDTLYVEMTPYNGYGCPFFVPVYLRDTLNLKADAGPDRTFCLNPSLKLGAQPLAGAVYNWSPSVALNRANIANPKASPTNSIKYILNIQNYAGGCRGSDTVDVVKQCAPVSIFVPTAFTPNGDGRNEMLKPLLSGYAKLNYFNIYNRNGNLVYHSTESNPSGWDGTYNGKKLSTQVMVWIAEGVNVNGGVDVKKGTVVLIR